MKARGQMTLDIEKIQTDQLNNTRLAAVDADGCQVGDLLVEYGEQDLDSEAIAQSLREANGLALEVPHGILEVQDVTVAKYDDTLHIYGEGTFEGRANCWSTGSCGIGRFYGDVKSVETSAWSHPIPWVLYDVARRLAGEWLPEDTPSGSRGSVKRAIMRDTIEALLSVNDRATLTE